MIRAQRERYNPRLNANYRSGPCNSICGDCQSNPKPSERVSGSRGRDDLCQPLFGTDVGYMSDYDPTEEYVLMAEAGMSFRQILASLTTAPAEQFGESKQLGWVAAGFQADLVILKNDPSKKCLPWRVQGLPYFLSRLGYETEFVVFSRQAPAFGTLYLYDQAGNAPSLIINPN